MIANVNRDPKKQKQPYNPDDFYFYQDIEDRNIPSGAYGAAAMRLIELRSFPSWALFVYKDLKEGASGSPPALLAYLGEDCMILAPQVTENSIRGMLVAMNSSSSEVRALNSPCGDSILVVIPQFEGKYYCQEDITIKKII